MAHRSPQQRGLRVRQMKWKIAKLMSARQKNWAASSTKMFSFLCHSGKEKFMKKSSRLLIGCPRAQKVSWKMPNSQLRASGKNSDSGRRWVMLWSCSDSRLIPRKKVSSRAEKNNHFLLGFSSHHSTLRNYEKCSNFFHREIRIGGGRWCCLLLHARADVSRCGYFHLIFNYSPMVGEFSHLHNNERINNLFPSVATVART